MAQDVLRRDPTSGAIFAFRGRRGDRVKLLYFDGQGFCLYDKILERGRFCWPSLADGVARLISTQLAMLWEGIDWRRPRWSSVPERVAVRQAESKPLADALTLIESAKLNGLNPEAYLADLLARINDHKINRLDELLLWNWQPLQQQKRKAP